MATSSVNISAFRRFESSTIAVSLFAAGYIVLVGNISLWRSVFRLMPISLGNFGFLLAEACFVFFAIHLVIAIFGFRYLFKPLLTGLFLATAFAAYFMDTYGAIIDSTMIQNVVETNLGEASELFSVRMVCYLFFFAVLPTLILNRAEIRHGSFGKQLLGQGIAVAVSLIAASVALVSHYKDFSLIGREHKELRMLMNPIYPLYAASRYLLTGEVGKRQVAPLGADATRALHVSSSAKKTLVILVVGETARAENFSLNGYSRETNPMLSSLPLFNFETTYACGTSTAVSVRCMFSNLGRDNFNQEDADGSEGVLDVLQRAGVQVLWRDNNSGCKGVCDRVPTVRLDAMRVPGVCNSEECYDDVLLYGLQQQLESLRADALIVLHQKGSHGPAYYKRTPAERKRFFPECTEVDVQNCSLDSIINAYDNTILYTDQFLANVVTLLQHNAAHFNAAMIYISDHGESLGESGIYLHGLPYLIAPDVQKRVPFLMWLSDDFRAHLGLEPTCFAAQTQQPVSHDHLFHSLLGVFDVQTSVYDGGLDVFGPCRSGNLVTRGKLVGTGSVMDEKS